MDAWTDGRMDGGAGAALRVTPAGNPPAASLNATAAPRHGPAPPGSLPPAEAAEKAGREGGVKAAAGPGRAGPMEPGGESGCWFLYYAYGSNLLRERLLLRNPSAALCALARLQVREGAAGGAGGG